MLGAVGGIQDVKLESLAYTGIKCLKRLFFYHPLTTFHLKPKSSWTGSDLLKMQVQDPVLPVELTVLFSPCKANVSFRSWFDQADIQCAGRGTWRS